MAQFWISASKSTTISSKVTVRAKNGEHARQSERDSYSKYGAEEMFCIE
jgi:hypothetical protein